MNEIIQGYDRPQRPQYQPPRRKGLLALFFALLLIGLGVYTGWWVWLASETERQIETWIDDQRAAGRHIDIGSLSTTGFPLKVEAMLSNVRLGDVKQGWTISFPAVRAFAEPWAVTDISGVVTFPMKLEIDRGRDQAVYDIVAQSNRFSVDAAYPAGAAFHGVGVEVKNTVGTARIEFEKLNIAARLGEDVEAGTFDLDAAGISLPDHVRSPFGAKVEALQANVDLRVQPIHEGAFPERLKGWSRDGGTLEVRSLTARHGAFEMSGDGTVAFDHELQPVGAFTARIAGYDAAVDALVGASLVGRQEGALAKAALGLFAKVPPGGGRKVVDVPLTVQNQRLSIGPIQLLRVPTVRWD